MNTAKAISSSFWGDRVHLLPKAAVYAFSLDLSVIKTGLSLRLESKDQLGGGLRHLFDQTILTTPEGMRCEVPIGTVTGGSGEIGDPNDSSSSWFNLKLVTKLMDSSATLHFDTSGVVNFDGGPSVMRVNEAKGALARSLRGLAFLSSCQTATTGTYRWLERRQIFGVGTVAGKLCNDSAKPADEWLLSFSFDFYAAG